MGDEADLEHATVGPRPTGAAERLEIDPVDRFQRSRRGSAGASERLCMAVYPETRFLRFCHVPAPQLRPPLANLALTFVRDEFKNAKQCNLRFPSIGFPRLIDKRAVGGLSHIALQCADDDRRLQSNR